MHDGKATHEYQDGAAFFQRTFITEGMRLLLMQVAQRLNGKGGEPVIQLQTAFGGGKTHTMLAVFHLATRRCPLDELAGVLPLLHQAGLEDVPAAQVAVLDGMAHAPGQPWSHGQTRIRTLWGELAWQLGGEEGYALVMEMLPCRPARPAAPRTLRARSSHSGLVIERASRPRAARRQRRPRRSSAPST